MQTENADLLNDPSIRQAGRALLSLALMDARNRNLQLLSAFEQAVDSASEAGQPVEPSAGAQAQWLLGRAGWFAESWLGRNTQRSLGVACPAQPTRTASIAPWTDACWHMDAGWFDPAPAGALPDSQSLRTFLLDTLEISLELLDKTPETDDALYFFRLALFVEDLTGERLITLAQSCGVPLRLERPAVAAPRDPVGVPAARWNLGSAPGGFVPDNEKWAHEVRVPEFEIDAQPVTWAQFLEFVSDGGYDRPEWWGEQGWAWLRSAPGGRRGPRHVEQLGAVTRAGGAGAVQQTQFGQGLRAAGHHPVTHVTWWEADAWCHWAGRRLPDEAEWELAAHAAARRGFVWGSVHEWTATSFQPYPGFASDPWAAYSQPYFGRARAVRGASWSTRRRWVYPKFRSFALQDADEHFVGFRSCAL